MASTELFLNPTFIGAHPSVNDVLNKAFGLKKTFTDFFTVSLQTPEEAVSVTVKIVSLPELFRNEYSGLLLFELLPSPNNQEELLLFIELFVNLILSGEQPIVSETSNFDIISGNTVRFLLVFSLQLLFVFTVSLMLYILFALSVFLKVCQM